MSFADQIKESYETAKSALEAQPIDDYKATLEEFAQGIKKLGVDARVQMASTSQAIAVLMSPLYRPAFATLLLRFELAGEGIIVFGQDQITLRSPEALRAWLLDFIKKPAVINTVKHLQEEATQPVEARLRSKSDDNDNNYDILVSIGPDHQKSIYETALNAELSLEVMREKFPGNPEFSSERLYPTLYSAGLIVQVNKVQPSDEKLLIQGHRIK